MSRATVLALLAAALAALSATRAGAAPAACRAPAHPPGWEAIFGYRATHAGAESLRRSAERVGFKHLVIEQVGCPRWAVALHGLKDARQARDFRAEAKRAGFALTTRCVPVRDLDPDWEAVFGSRLAYRAATRLKANAQRVGFVGLELLQDPCSATWSVQLDGIPTLRQAQDFRAEAKSAGYAVVIRTH